MRYVIRSIAALLAPCGATGLSFLAIGKLDVLRGWRQHGSHARGAVCCIACMRPISLRPSNTNQQGNSLLPCSSGLPSLPRGPWTRRDAPYRGQGALG
jgi:hypothetical protein